MLFCLILHLWFLFFHISFKEMALQEHCWCWFQWIKWTKIHNFVSVSATIFQLKQDISKAVFFSLLCKSIIMEIINMQMHHYLHNGKGYRALPYTKLKLMLCAFQPYIKLNFWFLWHISPFLRAGHILHGIYMSLHLHALNFTDATVSIALMLAFVSICNVPIDTLIWRTSIKEILPVPSRTTF